MRRAAALLIALWAGTAMAQEPPDYLDFMHQAERLAHASNSVGSCRSLGYTVEQAGIVTLMDRMFTSAEQGGMPRADADTILDGMVRAETTRESERAKSLDRTDKASLERFVDYWNRRCEALTRDVVFGLYFHDPVTP